LRQNYVDATDRKRSAGASGANPWKLKMKKYLNKIEKVEYKTQKKSRKIQQKCFF
jgi:hypothetical protein